MPHISLTLMTIITGSGMRRGYIDNRVYIECSYAVNHNVVD